MSEEELARAQQALVGNEEARRRDLAELRAHLGTVHAALLVDDIEHLHGCVAAEEIPGLIEELHRLDWLARHRIAMGEEDGHPTLGEVGVPVTHFLFGVLPDYLLDATETLLRASEAPWHGDAVGTVEGQFEKLVKLHDVLNDFFGHALEEGALVLPSSLTGVADEWRTPDSEACVDPLSALDALYHAVDRHYADDEREALALMDRIVAVNVWCDVDGARLEPCTQRKLLYLMLRLVNSARVVLADAFALIQEIQRAAR